MRKKNKTNRKKKTKTTLNNNNNNNKPSQKARDQPDNVHRTAAKTTDTVSSSGTSKVENVSKTRTTTTQSKNGSNKDNGTDASLESNDENQVVRRHRHRHHRNVYNDKQVNPLLHAQLLFLNSIPDFIRTNFFSDTTNGTITPQIRAEIWSKQADIGEELIDRYSWSTPDARALRILQYYDPIIEIGCGTNAYWCKVMRKLGVDVVGYDVSPLRGGKIKRNDNPDNKHDTVKQKQKTKKTKQKGKKRRKDEDVNIEEDDDDDDDDEEEEEAEEEEEVDNDEFRVRKGGPEVLSTKSIRESGRTLFLCYPDEEDTADMTSMTDEEQNTQQKRQSPSVYNNDDEKHYVPTSLGAQCLEHYTGQYIIHVGELYPDTLSYDQAPWGRSSSCEFQQRLASEFHCLLKAKLTNWPHVRDTISVWKRSERCTMVFQGDDDDDEEEEEVEYRHIPSEEMLPSDVAAPCLQHLLEWEENANSNGDETIVPCHMNDEKLDAESDGVNVGSSNESKKRKKKKRKKPSNTELKTIQDVNDGDFSENTADGKHTSNKEENGYACPW